MMIMKPPYEADRDAVTPTTRLVLPAIPSRPAAPPTGVRVLVIGPDFETIEPLQIALAETGHEVRLACSSADGIWLARDWRPGVVVCRLGYPELDGYAVAAELRRYFAGRHPLLIAVSDYKSAEDRGWAAMAGYAHHLNCPVDTSLLNRLLATRRP